MTAGSYLWARDVTSSGFANIVTAGGRAYFAGQSSLKEWSTHAYRRGTSAVNWTENNDYVSLRLEIKRAPEFSSDDLSQWANAQDFGATANNTSDDDGPAIQRAIDSGAQVVYLPYGQYTIKTPVIMRGAVRKLDGMFSILTSVKEGRVEAGTTTSGAAIIENVVPANTTFLQNGAGAMVVRDVGIATGYDSVHPTVATGPKATGDVFFESAGARASLVIDRPVHVWVRQLNRERVASSISGGATYWLLGDNIELHPEYGSADTTIVNSTAEIIGAAYDVLGYNGAYPRGGEAAYQAVDSTVSIMTPAALRSSTLEHWISDRRGGRAVGDVYDSDLVWSVRGQNSRVVVPLYVSPR
jgi:hypothetical protein